MFYDVDVLKVKIVDFGLSIGEMVVIVWDSVCMFCGLDLWGGVNGVCICLVL